AYVGYYHYCAEGMQSANGIRGRLEAWVTPNVSVHFAIQNDNVFDTTVSGGVAFHFGGTRPWRDGGPRSVEEGLGQRVVRAVNIVITQQTNVERAQFTLASDPDPVSPPPPKGSGGGSSGGSGTPTGTGSGTPPPPPPPPTAPPPPPKCPPPPPKKHDDDCVKV